MENDNDQTHSSNQFPSPVEPQQPTTPSATGFPQTSKPAQPQMSQTNVQVAQQPTQPTSDVQQTVTTQTTTPETGKESRKKLIVYYLIGLFTHIFGLVVAGLWIAVKVKDNKKRRLFSLLAGLGTAILLGALFSIFVSPRLQSTLVNKYPEMGYIPTELNRDYPDAQIGLNVNFTKSLSGADSGVTTSTLRVSIITNQDISASERKKVGEKVCTLLEQNNDSYTNVEIGQAKVKKILFFSFDQFFVEGRTCEEWKNDPPMELPTIPQ